MYVTSSRQLSMVKCKNSHEITRNWKKKKTHVCVILITITKLPTQRFFIFSVPALSKATTILRAVAR